MTGSGGEGASRRALLQGLVATGALASAARPAQASPEAVGGRGPIFAGAGMADVETANGRVRGFMRGGITMFRGIPYADTTGGANRFLPPKPAKPWTGVRSSLAYGPICPQDKGTGRQNDEEAFIFQWNDSFDGEDCLRINIWTPGTDNARRPVMVWLHGGGFVAGSGHDVPAFEGYNLAQRGDVVVVTLNQRLNLLGFLDLSSVDPAYAQSGNVGMLDIVAALQWVKRNIEVFGGDPGRVTIFGQSGGGAKVSTLMAMPAARGLFHRAIVQSGSFAKATPHAQARKLGQLMLAELGIGKTDLRALHSSPYDRLLAASSAIFRRENPPLPEGGSMEARTRGRYGFTPVVDGAVLPANPDAPQSLALSADVPLIVGTTLNEFTTGINQPDFFTMSEAELLNRADRYTGGRGAAVVAAFRRTTPEALSCDIWSRIATAPIRQTAIDQASGKAALRRAPAWLYSFDRSTPVLDGRPRAFHCAEIPYVFANAERCASMTGGDAEALKLEAEMADAWIAFARTGNPNHGGLAQWDPVVGHGAQTMRFDTVSAMRTGWDEAELGAMKG
ncbi:para-nitrobenzyl esterase [Sphingobium sp. B1D7B]|uniref:carboxylesterase/lipase family protein n=1 Tax=unclassified Sphingobium TaxID=2611147 RepID=UPI0022252534|nr:MULTISPECIES: carboxylesterase family protein [unclassified Sphingobium]MCW2392044.1 para-nitrobenzyl esterase [Sphingobium sp. B11D3A]MCW2403751.1 para-nitrobenzyl esterase [Sphingobium sp. B1D7B]